MKILNKLFTTLFSSDNSKYYLCNPNEIKLRNQNFHITLNKINTQYVKF